MPQSLAALEAKRSDLLQQFVGLGDLRPGSISAVVRRCGKPNCHCAKPDDPGHDPQLRLLHKVGGKSVAESFASPASFRKSAARSRRVPSDAEPEPRTDRPQRAGLPLAAGRARGGGLDRAGRRTSIAIHQEVAREIGALVHRVFVERRDRGGLDLEAVEMALRSALHGAGDRAFAMQFVVRVQAGSTEYANLINLTTGTATFTMTRDVYNSFTMLIQKMGFNVAELGNTDGIVMLQITGVQLYDPTNGMVTMTITTPLQGICQ